MATQTFFIFIPIWGNDPIWGAYFSDGLVQSPTSSQLLHLPPFVLEVGQFCVSLVSNGSILVILVTFQGVHKHPDFSCSNQFMSKKFAFNAKTMKFEGTSSYFFKKTQHATFWSNNSSNKINSYRKNRPSGLVFFWFQWNSIGISPMTFRPCVPEVLPSRHVTVWVNGRPGGKETGGERCRISWIYLEDHPRTWIRGQNPWWSVSSPKDGVVGPLPN